MTCTLSDIARQTGFSVSTVSRVLHDNSNRYKIREETKEVIRSVATALGYTPNKIARGLRLNRTHQMGIIVADLANPFFATMVKSISKEARKSGYSIVVCDSDENTHLEEESIKTLMENRVDGLLIAAVGVEREHLERFRSDDVPFVFLDRLYDDISDDAVSVDNRKGARDATEHLIQNGHRRIAILQGLPGTYANTGRVTGFRQAMADAGIEVRDQYVVGDDFGTLNGFLGTKHLLRMEDPPTAIFAAGYLIALGALDALREEHLVVPRDVALVTFDDPGFAPHLSPPLTAVEQPIEQMGEMGVKLLLRRLRDPSSAPRRILLEPRLIVRESVAPLVVPA
ncbi:MAG: LacI family DNA-binding transcriptional regulator [Bacteroidetes bacterium]|nr:LacI family DNA-binding transcriptional regulator [Bacteroidota bacterium]